MSASAAIAPDRKSLGIRELGQRFVLSRGQDRRVVKLVPAHDAAGRAERTVREQARLAVAQMQLALGEAGRMTEQAGHGVANAVGILDPFSEHHVAAAFAVDRPALGEPGKPAPEAPRGRERARMQLRITAGQPAHVAVVGRRLVGER